MNKIRKYLKYSVWLILVAGLFLLTGFINDSLSDEKCREIVIDIRDAESYGFIDETEITEILNRKFNTPISQKIRDIDTWSIEKLLNEHQAVENADVYISIDGKLTVYLVQRKVLIRLFTDNGSFYIDSKGKVMPVSSKFTAHVPVAGGEISFDYKSLLENTNRRPEDVDSSAIPDLYADIYKLSLFIDSNPFWKAQIEQLYVNKESEFELIPRVGNHTIVLGDVYDLDSKFDKLMLFYKKGLSKTGWNEYKEINLKYKDQVVCTKRF